MGPLFQSPTVTTSPAQGTQVLELGFWDIPSEASLTHTCCLSPLLELPSSTWPSSLPVHPHPLMDSESRPFASQMLRNTCFLGGACLHLRAPADCDSGNSASSAGPGTPSRGQPLSQSVEEARPPSSRTPKWCYQRKQDLSAPVETHVSRAQACFFIFQIVCII